MVTTYKKQKEEENSLKPTLKYIGSALFIALFIWASTKIYESRSIFSMPSKVSKLERKDSIKEIRLNTIENVVNTHIEVQKTTLENILDNQKNMNTKLDKLIEYQIKNK